MSSSSCAALSAIATRNNLEVHEKWCLHESRNPTTVAVLAALYRVHVTTGLSLHFRVNLHRVGAADSEHTYTEPDDQFYTGTGM